MAHELPANPYVFPCGGYQGIPLLDHFAGLALQGMLAADGNDPRWVGKDTGPEYQRGGGKWLDPQGVAQQAYELAAAMLWERTKHLGDK